MKSLSLTLAALAAATVASSAAPATNFKITEVLYTGLFGEFIEVFNLSGADITDLNKYSFDDSHAVVGKVPFPNVTLQNNQALIITEVSSTIFNQAWYTEPLTGSAPYTIPAHIAPVIIQNNTQNLGRADAINIFYTDAGVTTTVDKLEYNDQATPQNGPRSEDVSIVPWVNWIYTRNNATNFDTFLGVWQHDWILSSNANVPSSLKWKAGVSGVDPSNGDPIPGPIGSPGVFATSSAKAIADHP